MAFLALFDIWAENRIFLAKNHVFYKFRKMTQNMFNHHAINCRALLIDKLVMNPGLSYVRSTTSYMKYRAENHVIPTHHMTHSKCWRQSTRPVVAGDHSTLGDELILQISSNIFCFLNEN